MDVFDCYDWAVRKLTLHGCAVEISCACDSLQPVIDHLVRPFREAGFPDGFVPIRGMIEPYDLDDVLKHLPPRATAVPSESEERCELFRDGDRYFRLDEATGLTMLDPVRRRWHAWVTEAAIARDAVGLLDSAVMWPLSQLLSPRGLHLIPATAVERDGAGILLLSPLPLEPELSALAAAGYRLLGQRWTALREDDDRISLMHLPGHVMRRPSPRQPGELPPVQVQTPSAQSHSTAMKNAADSIIPRRQSVPIGRAAAVSAAASLSRKSNDRELETIAHSAARLDLSMPSIKRLDTVSPKLEPRVRSDLMRFDEPVWVDLLADGASGSHQAFCQLVLLCGSGRRQDMMIREVGWAGSLNVLRRAWPIAGLPPARHGGKLVSRLASRVRIAEMQLSRNPLDLVGAIDRLRNAPMPPHLSPIKLPVNSAMVRHMVRSSGRPARKSA